MPPVNNATSTSSRAIQHFNAKAHTMRSLEHRFQANYSTVGQGQLPKNLSRWGDALLMRVSGWQGRVFSPQDLGAITPNDLPNIWRHNKKQIPAGGFKVQFDMRLEPEVLNGSGFNCLSGNIEIGDATRATVTVWGHGPDKGAPRTGYFNDASKYHTVRLKVDFKDQSGQERSLMLNQRKGFTESTIVDKSAQGREDTHIRWASIPEVEAQESSIASRQSVAEVLKPVQAKITVPDTPVTRQNVFAALNDENDSDLDDVSVSDKENRVSQNDDESGALISNKKGASKTARKRRKINQKNLANSNRDKQSSNVALRQGEVARKDSLIFAAFLMLWQAIRSFFV